MVCAGRTAKGLKEIIMSKLKELTQGEINVLEANMIYCEPMMRNAVKHILEIVRADKKADDEPEFNVGNKVRFGEVGKPMQSGNGGYLDFSKDIKAILDGDFKPIDTTPIKADPIRITTDDWQSYRMELAAKIAVAYAYKKEHYEPEDIPAIAVKVANGVVERLKNGKV